MKAGTLVAVVILAGLGWLAIGSPWPSTARGMHEINEQVANDQVRQWGAVVDDPNHTLAEVCVHAQLVAAAYLQAGDDPKYHEWEKTSRDECPKETSDTPLSDRRQEVTDALHDYKIIVMDPRRQSERCDAAKRVAHAYAEVSDFPMMWAVHDGDVRLFCPSK